MTYLGAKVAGSRAKFGVPLPFAYADQAAAKEDPKKTLFNCYQRAHQNALETYQYTLWALTIGGLKHPLIASGAGLVYLLGRILYAHGYYTGNPEKRLYGSIHHVGILVLTGCSISFALTLLGHL